MAFLFLGGGLNSPWAFEAFIFATFFLASAGASAAYLTVSEIFPMETRALAIAFFYAVGTGLGGIVGPLLFGHLIATNSRGWVTAAFLIGAGVMALGGLAELFLGVRAEQAPLEDVAKPLTAEEAENDQLPGKGEKKRGDRGRLPYYSPGMVGTAGATRTAPAAVRGREIDAIAHALDENGPMRMPDLARAVGARRWGPGRFRDAVREALREGRAVRVSRSTIGPA
jgi:MFS family permease